MKEMDDEVHDIEQQQLEKEQEHMALQQKLTSLESVGMGVKFHCRNM